MKSQTKKVNLELVKQILRRTGWIGVVHFLILFLTMPVALYIETSLMDVQGTFSTINYEDILHLGMVYQGLIFIICPILLSLYLYRFLSEKYSTDFMHGLPISRKSILTHYLATGTVMLVGSILLIGITTLASQHLSGLPSLFDGQDYLFWIARTTLYTLVMFYIGAFVGMITGNSLTQLFVTYFILLIPYAIFYLAFNLLRHLLYGLSTSYLAEISTEHLSPLTSFFNTDVLTVEWIVYGALIILLPIMTYQLYKLRPSEASGNAFVFRVVPTSFKYTLTFVGMVAGGTFYEGFVRGTGWLYFGLLVGTFFGYWIAEILIQKTWRIKQWKGFAYFIVMMALIGGFIKLDLFGFVEKVPAAEEIASVSLSDEYASSYYLQMSSKELAFKSEEMIKETVNLHKQILEEKPNTGTVFAYNSLKIEYNLKNGSKLVREYSLEDASKLFDKTRAILYSQEADLNYVRYLESTVSKITNLSLNGTFNSGPTVMLGDQALMKEILACIREDLKLEGTAKNNQEPTYNLMTLTVEYSQNKPVVTFNIPTRFENTMDWLEERDYLDRLILSPSSVEKMTIVKGNVSMVDKLSALEIKELGSYKSQTDQNQVNRSVTEMFESTKDKIVVTDSKEIEKYMRKPVFATEKDVYYVKLDLADQTYQIWTIDNTRRNGLQQDYLYPYGIVE